MLYRFIPLLMLLSTDLMAHVGTTDSVQHSSEHLLLAVLLIPVIALLANKMLKK